MVKIFLVEDELIIRRNFRENIDWKSAGIEFTGDAADGELALPLIMSKHPDILITDIRMPFMDGLQLASIVKSKLPAIKIIVLTGYKDFDYAKEAIGIGVEDYLLKPITSEKLVEKIKTIAETIKKQQKEEKVIENYKVEISEKKMLEKNVFFSELISGHYTCKEILTKAVPLNISLPAESYSIFLLSILTSDGTSFEIPEIYEKLQLYAASENWICFNRGIEGFAVLCMNIDKQRWEKFKKQLTIEFSTITEVTYFGVLGSPVHRLSELQNSYIDAQKVFSMRFLNKDQNTLVFYSDIDLLKESSLLFPSFELDSEKLDWTLIEKFLKQGAGKEISSYVSEFFSSLTTTNLKIPYFRYYLIMNIYFCCSSFLQRTGYEKGCLVSVNKNSFLTFSEEKMKSFVESLLRKTIQLRDDKAGNHNTVMISKAKEYIQENFNSKEISLYSVAKKIGISSNYLSTLFSNETQMTFIEYLTSVRLEKAMELLMCTTMRSYEISYQVGYQDSHYFSYIFKKNFGMTPKEYRARKLKTENA